ncbi:MAG: DUF4386 family protein [Dehalococcoidia bacterium]
MLSKRGVDYLAGGLLLALVLTVVVFIATNPISADTFREDPAGVLRDIAENHSRFVLSTVFDIASNLIAIALAAALYLAFRAHDRNLALLGTFGFLAAGLLFLTADMVKISLESLSEGFPEARGAQAESLLNSARAVGYMVDGAVVMAFTGLAIGVLSYGLLVITTSALPRWIGGLGILGGLVAPFGWLLFVESDLIAIGFVGTLIGLLFALIAGSWLVLKGSSEVAQAAPGNTQDSPL